MSTLTFRAHCARDHDRVDFTDRAEFEQHMTTEHRARKRLAGGCADGHGPRVNAPGWSGGRIAAPHPHKAPRPSKGGLEKVAADIAAGAYRWSSTTSWIPDTPAAETAEERAA